MNFINILSAPSWLPIEVRNFLEPFLMILMVILSIATVVIILLQKGTADDIGTLAGSSNNESYLNKNKAKDSAKKLKIATLAMGIALVIVAILFFLVRSN